MKRTNYHEKKLPEMNLIRSIVWTFHKATRIDWAELFSEACLAYYDRLPHYDPSRGASETTWTYIVVRNALINFCKQETRSQSPLTKVQDWNEQTTEPSYEFFDDSMVVLSEDTRMIIAMVRSNPERYSDHRSRKVIGQIRRDLRERQEWRWQRIWKGMKNLRLELINQDIV